MFYDIRKQAEINIYRERYLKTNVYYLYNIKTFLITYSDFRKYFFSQYQVSIRYNDIML